VTVLSWEDLVGGTAGLEGPVDLTIGAFDGLHAGHRRLMTTITAEPRHATSLVVTFKKNPALLLGTRPFPGTILTNRQKLERLAELGVGAVAVVDFSEELSKLSGRAFVGLLRRNLAIRRIVVGHNFHFGWRRDTDAAGLAALLAGTGTEVRVEGPVLNRGEVVSSSRIRKSIQEAAFAEAREMLLADHALDLREVPVRRLGDGSLRAARAAVGQVLPRDGRYAVLCGGGERSAGAGGNVEAELLIEGESLTLAGPGAAGAAMVVFAHR
jgi:riboflavin kinase / FMN adenylyltransferase